MILSFWRKSSLKRFLMLAWCWCTRNLDASYHECKSTKNRLRRPLTKLSLLSQLLTEKELLSKSCRNFFAWFYCFQKGCRSSLKKRTNIGSSWFEMLPWLVIGIVLAFDFHDTCEKDVIFSIGAWLLIEFILFFIDVLLWNPQCFHIDPRSFYITFSIMSCVRLAWYLLGWLMYADFNCKSAANGVYLLIIEIINSLYFISFIL